jgi:hypothetical protein
VDCDATALDELATEKVEEAVRQAEEKTREDVANAVKQAVERSKQTFDEKVRTAKQAFDEKVRTAKMEMAEEAKAAEEKAKKEAQEWVDSVRHATGAIAKDESRARARERQAKWDEVGGFAINDAAREYCVDRWQQDNAKEGEQEEKLIKVDYAAIKQATNNFNEDTHLIGHGGCCRVFKAQVYGHPCAIKVFNETEGQEAWDNKQIKTEIKMLCTVRHPHLNRLLAASFNGPRRCLLLECMTGGALDTQLRSYSDPQLHAHAGTKAPRLGWEERATILLHTARGLVYLHSLNPPIIHRYSYPHPPRLTCSISTAPTFLIALSFN